LSSTITIPVKCPSAAGSVYGQRPRENFQGKRETVANAVTTEAQAPRQPLSAIGKLLAEL
jgi:hypothetical protein